MSDDQTPKPAAKKARNITASQLSAEDCARFDQLNEVLCFKVSELASMLIKIGMQHVDEITPNKKVEVVIRALDRGLSAYEVLDMCEHRWGLDPRQAGDLLSLAATWKRRAQIAKEEPTADQEVG